MDKMHSYYNTGNSRILNNTVDGDNNNLEDDIDREIMIPEHNRDWLDKFYMLSRIIIMFSIIYFYSSPLRFIIVAFIGLFVYLCHNKFFRVHPAAGDNGNRNVENNENLPNNPQIMEPGILMIARELLQRAINTNTNHRRRPNIILFAWTFLSSFFISLVPE
ncbi:homocysteine-responsive endoplasmic reticulum-resident ubiquitin-like domain member 2 protein [Copidosoma floridanum]|uniref:homocysteine-responsive endoplasmic reticulum-resident ubiquitin-like domain member 2 protein n=1 Tax=Copidosoma floridanum TaxID=29053 RepID=UPI0006C97DFA|nr:homocysteine-responsive endoplasmic reticulum-resident ubiquitin-like domain member 2 protein [Copidosoma floridanum]